MKGWYGDKTRHMMASKGIRTKMNANGIGDYNDFKNFLKLKRPKIYNMPYDKKIMSNEFNKYAVDGYQYIIPLFINDFGEESGIEVSPKFATFGELEDWWIDNGVKIQKMIDERINNYNHWEETKEFDIEIKSYDKLIENLYDIYDSSPRLSEMGYNIDEDIYKLIKPYENNDRYVNVYYADRGYGGAEEGGWWYDIKEPVLTVRTKDQESGLKWKEELLKEYPYTGRRNNVNGGDDFDIRVEGSIGEYSPKYQPRYS